jgi:hypothetical protein
MRDLVANLALTTLASGISSGALSLTVATGTGALFPNPTSSTPGNLIIVVESELMLCSGVTGDTLTITTRGYEGTTAVSHTTNAPVSIVMTAGMLEHLWSNLPDHFVPDVPPAWRSGGSPSTWDDEFESSPGTYTLYPNDGNLTVDYSSTQKSHAFLKRVASATAYYLYKPFAPSGAFTATCKLSHAGRYITNTTAWIWFFISDQSTPTGSLTAGNRLLLGRGVDYSYAESIGYASGGSHSWLMRVIQQANSVSGTVVWNTANILQDQGFDYLRMSYDGSGNWTQSISTDGLTYDIIGSVYQVMTPATIGWNLTSTGTPIFQQAAIDWLRVTQP